MIIDILERWFNFRPSTTSREEAKRRLKFVLAYDRCGLSSEAFEAMRKEILEVVSRYVEIDSEEIEFSLESSDRLTALIANLPIRRVKEVLPPEEVKVNIP